MNRLIVNMAVIKVNWDQAIAAPFLDNYLSIVIYALKQMTGDAVTVHEFREKFSGVADFSIPYNVALVLLNRVMKKHKCISRTASGIYVIEKNKLPESDYIETRNRQERSFNQLSDHFIDYCFREFNEKISIDEVGRYLFELLYAISPRLLDSANLESISEVDLEGPRWRFSYFVSRFVNYAVNRDQASLDIILSFVRGAMLTETFYYQAPDDIQKKIEDVSVYLDTSILLELFGFGNELQILPVREMVSMLQELNVPLYCFVKTRGEIDSILYAISIKAKQNGRVKDARPGSVGEFFNRRGLKSSDIEVERNRIDKYLEDYKIEVVDPPAYLNKWGIDEKSLNAAIKGRIPYQSEDSRARDIDCIAAIFRLRQGKVKRRLLDCKAIFVTKNSDLASASARFFNDHYGHSDTPLCMPDQVFTTLVWLKTANKAPDLPRERIVANCIAAVQPSEETWQRYSIEAKKLLEQGTITENDYELLVHSTDTQLHLMDLTFGDSNRVSGTVEEVLALSKNEILHDTLEENKELKVAVKKQEEEISKIISKLKSGIECVVNFALIIVTVGLLLYGLTASWPENYSFSSLFPVLAISLMLVVTILNLVFGTSLKEYIDHLAKKTSGWAISFLEEKSQRGK